MGASAGWTHGAAVTRFSARGQHGVCFPLEASTGMPQPASRLHPAGAAPHDHAPTEDLGLGGRRAVPALQSHPSGVWQGSPGEVCFPFPVLQVTLEMRRLETINILIA